MARGKKTGGRNFKKGHKPKGGRPPTPPDIKSARQINQIEVERIYHALLNAKQDELDVWIEDKNKSVLEVAVAKVMRKAIDQGDVFRLEMVLNRCVGPVKTRVEHSGSLTLEDIVAGSREKK